MVLAFVHGETGVPADPRVLEGGTIRVGDPVVAEADQARATTSSVTSTA